MVIVGMVIACGCSESGADPRVQRTDSAGVTIVEHTGADRPLSWSMEEILRLGGAEEGPESFFGLNATSVAADREGRIYILDVPNSEVHLFARDGEHVRSMGGQGGGPGAMQDPSMLLVRGGEVQVIDFRKRALVRFDTQGVVLPEIRLPSTVDARSRVAAAMNGGLIAARDTVAGHLAPGAPIRRVVILHAADQDGSWLPPTELVSLHWEQPATFNPVGSQSCPIKIRTPPVFTHEPIWRSHQDKVLYNDMEEYRVDVRDSVGQRTSIRRALPVRDATRELAAKDIGPVSWTLEGASCDQSGEERADQAGWLPRIPWVLDITVTPAGEVLVLRRAPDEDVRARVDVFEPSGAYVGTLPPEFSMPVLWRTADEFIQLERDELDLPYVVVYRVRREGS